MRNETRNVLVTGCAGFVGRHLTRRLLDQGIVVAGVDDFSSSSTSALREFRDRAGFRFQEGDFTTPGLLNRVQGQYGPLQAVFHLAARVSVPYSLAHPEETLEVNHRATLALHAEAQALGVPAFVFAGSAAEYGDCERLPLAEDDADDSIHHLSPYGRSKWLASRGIEASGYGCSLRFFNIYGPGQPTGSPYSGVITLFIHRALTGEPLVIHGDGSQTRDFLFIDDAVDAYLAAAGLDGEPPLTGIYNVGSGQTVSIRELAEAIQKLTLCPHPIRHDEPRPGDILHSRADIGRLSATGRFSPSITLEQGLLETVAWARSVTRN